MFPMCHCERFSVLLHNNTITIRKVQGRYRLKKALHYIVDMLLPYYVVTDEMLEATCIALMGWPMHITITDMVNNHGMANYMV